MKKVLLVFVVLACLVGIGSAVSGNKTTSPNDDSSAADVSVAGTFHRDCLSCSPGDLSSMVATSDVWCGWNGDHVIVHVVMTNNSAEHVTVSWHPSYTIANGAGHGEGLTSLEDSGFDAGETRELMSEQKPDGVAVGSTIGSCKPSFYLVKSG